MVKFFLPIFLEISELYKAEATELPEVKFKNGEAPLTKTCYVFIDSKDFMAHSKMVEIQKYDVKTSILK